MTKLKWAYSLSWNWMCNHSDNGWVTYHRRVVLKLEETKTNLLWLSNFVHNFNCISKPCEKVVICPEGISATVLGKTVISIYWENHFCMKVIDKQKQKNKMKQQYSLIFYGSMFLYELYALFQVLWAYYLLIYWIFTFMLIFNRWNNKGKIFVSYVAWNI